MQTVKVYQHLTIVELNYVLFIVISTPSTKTQNQRKKENKIEVAVIRLTSLTCIVATVVPLEAVSWPSPIGSPVAAISASFFLSTEASASIL